jgi:hypothetical protein
MFLSEYSTSLQGPLGWSCTQTHMIHLALVTVPSPWMRGSSWWQLSAIGCSWSLTVVLSTRGGTSSSPSAAAECDPSSLDEEAESSSEFASSTTSVFDFFQGGGVRTIHRREPIIVAEIDGFDGAIFV